MIHNDVLRSLRHTLNLRDPAFAEIFREGGWPVTADELRAYLKPEDEAGCIPCPDRTMAHFLDGLIYHLRGKDPARPVPPIELPVTNNVILKKLRVAFTLKEQDVVTILRQAGFAVGANELNAFFRRADHPLYQECGDQYLRNFLKGLGKGPKS